MSKNETNALLVRKGKIVMMIQMFDVKFKLAHVCVYKVKIKGKNWQ